MEALMNMNTQKLFYIFLKLSVVNLLIGGISHSAHALFDIRLTGTILASKPDLTQIYTGSSTIPTYSPTLGLGGDFLFSPPLTDFGFGIRYENLGASFSKDGLSFKATNMRTAALIDYRFINTLFLLGIIGSYGLSHTSGFQVTESVSGIDSNWEASSSSSLSIGIEAGVKLLGFIIGVEVGQESMKWNNLTDKNNSNSGTVNLDMSGAYTKAFLGFGF